MYIYIHTQRTITIYNIIPSELFNNHMYIYVPWSPRRHHWVPQQVAHAASLVPPSKANPVYFGVKHDLSCCFEKNHDIRHFSDFVFFITTLEISLIVFLSLTPFEISLICLYSSARSLVFFTLWQSNTASWKIHYLVRWCSYWNLPFPVDFCHVLYETSFPS